MLRVILIVGHADTLCLSHEVHVHKLMSSDKGITEAVKDQGYAILGLPIFANVETVTHKKDLFEKEASAYKANYGTDLSTTPA